MPKSAPSATVSATGCPRGPAAPSSPLGAARAAQSSRLRATATVSPVTTVGRLRGRRTFAALAAQGRTVRNGPLRVRYLAASDDGSQVGYAIGRSVGGAVVRNRIRRRLRAAVASAEYAADQRFLSDLGRYTAPRRCRFPSSSRPCRPPLRASKRPAREPSGPGDARACALVPPPQRRPSAALPVPPQLLGLRPRGPRSATAPCAARG